MVSSRGIGEALNIRATQTKAVKLSDRMKCDIGHGTADEKMMEMEVMVTSVRFAANKSYYIILTPRDVTFWRSRIHSSFLVFFCCSFVSNLRSWKISLLVVWQQFGLLVIE